MTVDAAAPEGAGDGATGAPDTVVAPGPLLQTPLHAPLQTRSPRPGELTPGWRLVTTITWIGVAVAVGSVWKTSDQLGMSTWWLGPRGDPRPVIVQILPFVPAVLMVIIAINHVRHVAWFGALASASVIAVGVVDLGFKAELGLLEIAIGLAAAIVSLASLTGVYRPISTNTAIDVS